MFDPRPGLGLPMRGNSMVKRLLTSTSGPMALNPTCQTSLRMSRGLSKDLGLPSLEGTSGILFEALHWIGVAGCVGRMGPHVAPSAPLLPAGQLSQLFANDPEYQVHFPQHLSFRRLQGRPALHSSGN